MDIFRISKTLKIIDQKNTCDTHCLLAFMLFKSRFLLVVTLHMEYHCCSTPKLFSTLVARMERPAKVRFQLYSKFQLLPSTSPTSCVSLEVFPEVVLPSEYFATKVAGEDGFGRSWAVSPLCVLQPPWPVGKLFATRGADHPLFA